MSCKTEKILYVREGKNIGSQSLCKHCKQSACGQHLKISFSSVNIFWFVVFVLLWSWSADTYEAGFFKANRLQTH
jgi:hypothetical protein